MAGYFAMLRKYKFAANEITSPCHAQFTELFIQFSIRTAMEDHTREDVIEDFGCHCSHSPPMSRCPCGRAGFCYRVSITKVVIINLENLRRRFRPWYLLESGLG